ncbi:hypothetical protein EC968_008239, partial [Mortierella alpina]
MPTCPYDTSLVLKPLLLVYVSFILVTISSVSLLSKVFTNIDEDGRREQELRLCVLYKDGSTFIGERYPYNGRDQIVIEGIPLIPKGNGSKSGFLHITREKAPAPQKWWHPVKTILSHMSVVSTVVTIIPSWVVVVDFLKSGYRAGVSQCAINVLLLMCSINWIWNVRDCQLYWRERNYRKKGSISWARFEDAREFIEEGRQYSLIDESTEVTSDMNVVRIVSWYHHTGTAFAKF